MEVTQEMINNAIDNGTAVDCAKILRSEWDSLSVQEVEDLTFRLIEMTIGEPNG